jgi:hypothetical protein
MIGSGLRADSHRDLYAPKRIFSPYYCDKKPWQVSALPSLFLLSYGKSSPFGVLRSFELQIFLHGGHRQLQKYWMYFKDDGGRYGGKDAFKTV